MYTVGMAYCGSGNNKAIRRLLHVAVSTSRLALLFRTGCLKPVMIIIVMMIRLSRLMTVEVCKYCGDDYWWLLVLLVSGMVTQLGRSFISLNFYSLPPDV